jgi:hypothetical protein
VCPEQFIFPSPFGRLRLAWRSSGLVNVPDNGASHRGRLIVQYIVSTGRESRPTKPAWVTVFLIVVVLSLAALPGSIAAGITPILIVGSAVALVLSTFAKE